MNRNSILPAGRVLVVGDVHGNYKTLKALVKNFNPQSKDHIYFLGDLINKGPSTGKTLKYIYKLGKKCTVKSVRGNHEYELKQQLKRGKLEETYLTELYPKEELQLRIHHRKLMPKKHKKVLKRLKKSICVGKYILVHAGLRFSAKKPLKDKIPLYYLRKWYQNIDYNYLDGRIILHGHTPITLKECQSMHKKIHKKQYLNLDTGILLTDSKGQGYLSALELHSNKLIHQKNVD